MIKSRIYKVRIAQYKCQISLFQSEATTLRNLQVVKLVKYNILEHRVTWFLDFFHRPVFFGSRNTTFRKLDVLPSSGEEGKRTLLSWAP
jgi:hypothetical protein